MKRLPGELFSWFGKLCLSGHSADHSKSQSITGYFGAAGGLLNRSEPSGGIGQTGGVV
jgi:hypothetical protein